MDDAARDSSPLVAHPDDVVGERWDDPVRGAIGFRTLLGGEHPTGSLTAGLAELGPGDWLGHHRHEPAEVNHVVEGRGVAVVDGEEVALRPGTTALVPGDAEHGVHNPGPGPLRVFHAYAVGSFVEVEYRFRDA